MNEIFMEIVKKSDENVSRGGRGRKRRYRGRGRGGRGKGRGGSGVKRGETRADGGIRNKIAAQQENSTTGKNSSGTSLVQNLESGKNNARSRKKKGTQHQGGSKSQSKKKNMEVDENSKKKKKKKKSRSRRKDQNSSSDTTSTANGAIGSGNVNANRKTNQNGRYEESSSKHSALNGGDDNSNTPGIIRNRNQNPPSPPVATSSSSRKNRSNFEEVEKNSRKGGRVPGILHVSTNAPRSMSPNRRYKRREYVDNRPQKSIKQSSLALLMEMQEARSRTSSMASNGTGYGGRERGRLRFPHGRGRSGSFDKRNRGNSRDFDINGGRRMTSRDYEEEREREEIDRMEQGHVKSGRAFEELQKMVEVRARQCRERGGKSRPPSWKFSRLPLDTPGRPKGNDGNFMAEVEYDGMFARRYGPSKVKARNAAAARMLAFAGVEPDEEQPLDSKKEKSSNTTNESNSNNGDDSSNGGGGAPLVKGGAKKLTPEQIEEQRKRMELMQRQQGVLNEAKRINSSIQRCCHQGNKKPDIDGVWQLVEKLAELAGSNRVVERDETGKIVVAAKDSILRKKLKCPEQSKIIAILRMCCRNALLDRTQSIFDLMEHADMKMEVGMAVNLLGCVTQRCTSHSGMEFVKNLVCFVRFDTPEGHMYFKRHASLTVCEFVAEAESAFDSIQNRPAAFLAAVGKCELNLQLKPLNKGTGKKTDFRLVGGGGRDTHRDFASLSEFGFRRGDSALLSIDRGPGGAAIENYSPADDGAEVELVQVSPALIVRLRGPEPTGLEVHNANGCMWRIDKLGNRNAYMRQLQALQVLCTKPARKSGGYPSRREIDPRRLQPHDAVLRAILCPTSESLDEHPEGDPSTERVMDNVKYERMASECDEVLGENSRFPLNGSQLGAVKSAISNRLTLVQGPPGTGKTYTAVQILTRIVQCGLQPMPLLATSDSNIAVDNLVEGLAMQGINVVRVGRPENIRKDLLEYSLDWLTGGGSKKGNARGGRGGGNKVTDRQILKRAEVICATCIGSGSDMLNKFRFGTVLVDESTQATETAVLVPLTRGCQQLVLVGDHCQLPPTVVSDVAQRAGLAVSLFSRLVNQGVRPKLLNTQYRMHPVIAEFASDSFYGGLLETGCSHRDRLPPMGVKWPGGMPVMFIDVPKSEELKEGHSYVNPREAEKVISVMQELLKSNDLANGVDDIGIIAPYASQVRLLRRTLRSTPALRALQNVEVSSVDGFQGREKEVIIFTAVRSNLEGNIGFLADWRRMNVMLTRARRGIVVVGNRRTLKYDKVWSAWVRWAEATGCVAGEGQKGNYAPEFLGDTEMGYAAHLEGDLEGIGGGSSPTSKGKATLAAYKEAAARRAAAAAAPKQRPRGGSGAWDSDSTQGDLSPQGTGNKKIAQYEGESWEDFASDGEPGVLDSPVLQSIKSVRNVSPRIGSPLAKGEKAFSLF